MARLPESEITKYLETFEDSEDGLDGSDSEVEDEAHYYQTARDVLRDLENSDEGENAQSDKVDADPPLVIDNDENMPDPPILEGEEAAPQSRSQGISKRPLVWRNRNLITAEDSLIFRGETQITEALMSCNTPLELAEMLCKLGLPANGAKRGRPSGSTIQRELVMKKFRGPAQAIPLKDVRLDQTCHWAVWLDKQQRCKFPKCSGIQNVPKMSCIFM
ncbi:unnamed protein product [Arctia plantaginis]|uniref:Uncharacterized protein n=1 Tax=Arctia plantaginis TaxID=874455 RepID=A0A8S0YYN1_ARCPL|nr:unnamed protein product [Arctia plantaginis]